MNRNSTPAGGSPLEKRLRSLTQEQIRIQEEELLKALPIFETHVRSFTERLKGELGSIHGNTVQEARLAASQILQQTEALVREIEKKVARVRRPWWARLGPLVLVLLGMAIIPLVETGRQVWEDWDWDQQMEARQWRAILAAGGQLRGGSNDSIWLAMPANRVRSAEGRPAEMFFRLTEE